MGADAGEAVDLGIAGLGPAVPVGRGGFGLVYRAMQVSSGGVVAVKVLQGHLDDTARTRFEREAAALGSLRGHPNICTVYDAGVDPAGRPYLVMEYAPSSLAQRIADLRVLPWQDAAALAVRLAGALETAHRANLLHRDVKPENVLLTAFGEWRLADFGLARFTDDTVSRGVTTTVSHAAPELLEGAPPSVASDVYALGSTLFTALTGRAAFALADGAHQASVYRRIAEEPVPDMPEVPGAVADVVRTAMAKDPAARYSSAAEMGEALRQAQRSAGVDVTPLPLPLGDAGGNASPDLGAGLEDLTVDAKTPQRREDVTRAVERGGREVPAEEGGGGVPVTEQRRGLDRRVLIAASALLAAVAIGSALALAGGGGRGDDVRDNDASPGGISGEPALAEEWEVESLTIENCVGADDGPCPDTSGFELDFSIGCPSGAAGGQGRSIGQEAAADCEISLWGEDPEPLEFDGTYGSASLTREGPAGGLVMEYGDECTDASVYHSIEFWSEAEEERFGVSVVTELTGSLYVYLLFSGDRSCGSSYEISFNMRATS